MKRTIFGLLMIVLLASACAPTTSVGEIFPPFIDTGVNPDSWVKIPAGEFPYGQHDHMTMLDEYQIMVTDVTNQQYADFINQALADGTLRRFSHANSDGYPVRRIIWRYRTWPFSGFRGREGDKRSPWRPCHIRQLLRLCRHDHDRDRPHLEPDHRYADILRNRLCHSALYP